MPSERHGVPPQVQQRVSVTSGSSDYSPQQRSLDPQAQAAHSQPGGHPRVQRPPGVRPPPLSAARPKRGSPALWLLEDPTNLRDLLRLVEPQVAERLDFSRAERVNRSFIPTNLQKRESDLIFSVPWRRGEARKAPQVWVYVLLEHQSRPTPAAI